MGSFSNSLPGDGVACPVELRELGFVIKGRSFFPVHNTYILHLAKRVIRFLFYRKSIENLLLSIAWHEMWIV